MSALNECGFNFTCDYFVVVNIKATLAIGQAYLYSLCTYMQVAAGSKLSMFQVSGSLSNDFE